MIKSLLNPITLIGDLENPHKRARDHLRGFGSALHHLKQKSPVQREIGSCLSAQSEDGDLAAEFAPLAEALANSEAAILAELSQTSGSVADTGGYFRNDDAMTAAVMRPSKTLNDIID